MRLGATKTGASTTYNGLGDQLYDKGGAKPTLDLNFASNGSLVDSVTGKTLVTHTRASNATYVDGDGIIKDAALNYLKYSEDIGFSGWNVRSGTTATANQEAPNGSNTATLITNSSGDGYVWRNDAGFSAGGEFVLSVYAKKVSGTPTLTPSMWLGTFTGASTDPAASVTDEWVRYDFNVTRQYVAGAQDYGFFVKDGSVLLWGAQLEESSTVGEYVKTTSTINSAPRFDHKVTRTTTNYIPYSEAILSNSVAGPNRTIVDNTILAPDGALTAATVTATGTDPYVVINTLSNSGAGTYTFSVYLKGHPNNSSQTCKLRVQDAGTGLQTGSAFDITGEWRRYSFTVTTTGDLQNVRLDIPDVAVSGDIVYVWGFQIEANSDVGPYVKTTGAAATKVDAEPLGLLVEESKTNLITNSDLLSDFINHTAGSFTVVTETAPDNGTQAVQIVANPTLGRCRIRFNTAASANNITVSAFVKKDTHRYVHIGFGGNSNNFAATFDIEPGVTNRLMGQGGTGTYTNLGAGYQDYANGWVRIWAVGTTSGTDGPGIGIVEDGTKISFGQGTNNYDGTESIYIWGYQYEDNATFPTSYIRTSGSTVVRSADVTSIEGNDFGTFNLLEYSEEFDQSYWTKTNATVVPNSIANPLTGKFTADTLVATAASGSHFLNRSITSAANSTVSVYAKAAGYNYIEVNGYTNGVNQNRVTVNLTDGTVANNTNSLPVSVSSVGNGWYRIALTLTNGGSYATFGLSTDGTVNQTFTGDGTSGIYLWGAQLEESSTATPYVKSDVTWTSRASNATYYDYTGTLRKSSYNRLLRSEEFDSGNWVKTKSSVTTGFEAPDGSSSAKKLTVNTEFGRHYVAQSTGITAGGTYTISCYAKAGEYNYATVVFGKGSSPYTRAGSTVDLTTGEITPYVVDSPTSVVRHSAQDVGNGWWRISVTVQIDGVSTNGYSEIGVSSTDANYSNFTGDGTSGIYIWGAQLETGTYAGDYAKTTTSAASSARNVAFLPDGNGNFVSAGELLLEDAGTNLALRSEDLTLSPWNSNFSGAGATATNGTYTAPDNSTTVTKITFNQRYGARQQDINTSDGVSYTFSGYVKRISGPTSYSFGHWGSASGNGTGGLTVTDEWTRFEITVLGRSGGGNVGFSIQTTATSDFGELLVWGVQVEANTYATSYIPTYGSTATRAADVSSSSSNTFGNSFYNQNASTVFVDWHRNNDVYFQTYSPFFRVQRSAPYEALTFGNTNGVGNTNGIYWTASVGGVNQLAYKQYGAVVGSNTHAIALTTDDAAFSYKGNVSDRTDNSFTMPTALQQAMIGKVNNPIKRITYWPKRLSNESLDKMTN